MPHKILLVDDSQLVHRLVQTLLAKDGVEVRSVYDAPSAAAAAIEMQPAVILLDMELPPHSGIDVCRELKANPLTRGCMVIMLSGNDDPECQARAGDAGAADYITKPFTPNDFRVRIRNSLRNAARSAAAA